MGSVFNSLLTLRHGWDKGLVPGKSLLGVELRQEAGGGRGFHLRCYDSDLVRDNARVVQPLLESEDSHWQVQVQCFAVIQSVVIEAKAKRYKCWSLNICLTRVIIRVKPVMSTMLSEFRSRAMSPRKRTTRLYLRKLSHEHMQWKIKLYFTRY